MLNLYCDESDDGHTCALVGWVATTEDWDRLSAAWRAMLETITMPDGSRCPAFHAAEIVERDKITGSRFRGWTFQQETEAFTKATDLIVDTRLCPALTPIGSAVEVPNTFGLHRNEIWLLLFIKLFTMLLARFPVTERFSFMCDEKQGIKRRILETYASARDRFNRIPGLGPRKFAGTLAFGSDEQEPPLQIADLLAYEWRKRISDARLRPNKPVRTPFRRMREARPGGALWRFGRDLYELALNEKDQSGAWVDSVRNAKPIPD